VGCCSLKV
jgi:DNA topoisomerase I